ncbi:MAG: hypothetical protein J7K21_03205 [Desulfurococcales archaeon]|nr:hypothetical protein [Desulfurococcales archaeon]
MRILRSYISDYARSLNPYEVYARLNPIKKLLLKILGVVKLETLYVKTPVGTEGVASVYLVKCPKCGRLYIDYHTDIQNTWNAQNAKREYIST